MPEGILLGIGNPLLDITVTADVEFLEKYGLKANNAIIAQPKHLQLFEEVMLNFKPQFGAGGATQNSIRVAQWLLGTSGSTTFFGAVGVDRAAEILRSKAEEDGVNVKYCVTESLPTGKCVSIVTGENRSLVAHLGAADFFAHAWLEQEEQWRLVEQAQFFYIGGFVFPVCHGTIFAIAEHATRQRKTLVMNLSALFLCKYFADRKHDVMQHIDILFGNESEAREFCRLRDITGADDLELASKMSLIPKADARGRTVVVTRGTDSTVVARDGDVKTFPILPVLKAEIRDTNGCGDSFVGGFLSQLVRGKSVEECVACGNYAANYVIKQWGCRLPTPPTFGGN